MRNTVYIVNESTKNSVITDIVTFGVLIGSFWVNYQFLGDGIILQLVLGICFFINLVAKAISFSKKMTVKEAREYFCRKTKDDH